ncbi:MAG: fimbrillin family protein [Muribaculaceae bacterium]|nr:fimbrillin family protein [Muribaculaceae bacterium]
MNINQSIKAVISSVIMLTAVSCNEAWDNPSEDGVSYPLVVYAEIVGQVKSESRANRTEINDMWSITAFTENDKIGIFASAGNFADDNGPFNNYELTYLVSADGEMFKGEDGATFSPTAMNGNEAVIYYPYSKDVTNPGMWLRTTAEGETSPLRCVDMLVSTELVIAGENSALYGKMGHLFAELIIMRGPGFDDPPQGLDRITAVLSDPVTRVKIEMTTDPWNCVPEMVYIENDGNMTKDDARKWDAWKGGEFQPTEQDEGKPAWYVIVPTVGSNEGITRPGNRSIVDYIELYDNQGHLQRVSGLQLSGHNSKYVDAGWRYPLEITMNELVPTVSVFPILPWGEDINLTDERKRGINNLAEFANWIHDYNLYVLTPENEEKVQALLKYGDKYQDPEGKISWHFYLLTDIDLTNYNPLPYEDLNGSTITESEFILPKLQDILDGKSTTLVNGKFLNHKIIGLNKTFVGEMTTNSSNQNNGSIQNVDFVNPDVKKEETSDTPTGIIANSMNGASVINCRILQGSLYNPGGPAGMITGTINDGTIRDCSVSNFMVCKSTATGDASRIVGVNPTGECTFVNNNVDVAMNNETEQP